MHRITSWFTPAPPSGVDTQDDSLVSGDTIIAAALGAIALISAHAFDRTNPALATLLRCTAGGIGLIWIFNRYCRATTDYSPHVHSGYHAHHVHHDHYVDEISSPPVIHASRPRVSRVPTYHASVATFTKGPPHFTQEAHTTYSASDYSGVPSGFPTVECAHAHPDMKPVYRAPVTVHVDAKGHKPPKQAHTTYSASDYSGVPTGFPTVHRAAAQHDTKPMHPVPVSDHVHAKKHKSSEHTAHTTYSHAATAPPSHASQLDEWRRVHGMRIHTATWIPSADKDTGWWDFSESATHPIPAMIHSEARPANLDTERVMFQAAY